MSFEYQYPRPALTVDAVVLREIDSRGAVLLIRRQHEPFANCWALPGGFVDLDETLEQAVARELKEETGLNADSIRQIAAFSAIDRDPRERVVSVAFAVEVSEWSALQAGDDAKEADWFWLDQLPPLAFDHAIIIQAAILQRDQA